MVKVNGESFEMDGRSVAFMLDSLKYDRTRVAVEINEEIVPRATYENTILKNGDTVEVVSFVGGGWKTGEVVSFVGGGWKTAEESPKKQVINREFTSDSEEIGWKKGDLSSQFVTRIDRKMEINMDNNIPSKEEFYEALSVRHGKDNQEKFRAATVAILGLGGLGSNVSICLARAGIGKLILIDFDKVDITNIHRQQYKLEQIGLEKTKALADNLSEINPFMEIETHQVKVNESNIHQLLNEADIVCEAFDNAKSKAMLVNYVLEHFPDKYIISGSGMAGFNCANMISTKKISKRFYLCGDGVSDVNLGIGLISSRVMACAAHEAHMVLRILMGETDV